MLTTGLSPFQRCILQVVIGQGAKRLLEVKVDGPKINLSLR